LRVIAVEPGCYFLAHAPADASARGRGERWIAASWLLSVEPLSNQRCRLISRYRMDCSDDLVTRIGFGPTLVEPVGFAMDRRMLLGIKERAERAAHARPLLTVPALAAR
jgi:hypothetical protein